MVAFGVGLLAGMVSWRLWKRKHSKREFCDGALNVLFNWQIIHDCLSGILLALALCSCL